MSEQYWNYNGKTWWWTDKPIRGREYFLDFVFYGIKVYNQIVPGFRNHPLGAKCDCKYSDRSPEGAGF